MLAQETEVYRSKLLIFVLGLGLLVLTSSLPTSHFTNFGISSGCFGVVQSETSKPQGLFFFFNNKKMPKLRCTSKLIDYM